ncbi:O-antigen ligase family protein [Desmonostoc muscorum LEGE 12446]|nr:O-antigen ligase family protein [Desmonostoc muscorum]MCF2149956.1 O-antigen ligase family protein [Desmonostoc muscorum LEGE 12446]
MLTNQRSMILRIGLIGVGIGSLTAFEPLYLGLVVGAIAVVFLFFARFEQTVLGLLILRSALDPFSAYQIPSLFAIAVDVLTLLYVAVTLLTGRIVRTDKFWWLFAGWVALQGLGVILIPLEEQGLDGGAFLDSIREWVRLFSWLMVYLLVMQLQDRIHPQKIISALFFALILPLTVATIQMLVPVSLLPAILQATKDPISGEISRINGTLGLSNTFATFLLLFIGLTYWKVNQSQRRWPWLILLGVLGFFYVNTKTLFSLMMLGILIMVLIAPRLSLINLIGGVFLFAVVIVLFGSTEFGQQRLTSLTQTPLLNPDLDISRAIILSHGDGNSFNWRLAQWSLLIQAWEQSPILGYGLASSRYLTIYNNYAHNDYVRALAEGGIFGLLAFLFFLGLQATHLIELLGRTSSTSAQQDLCRVLLAILAAVVVGMISENIWSHTTFFFYWWTLFAVAGWNWEWGVGEMREMGG